MACGASGSSRRHSVCDDVCVAVPWRALDAELLEKALARDHRPMLRCPPPLPHHLVRVGVGVGVGVRVSVRLRFRARVRVGLAFAPAETRPAATCALVARVPWAEHVSRCVSSTWLGWG
eukprot:scaffold34014_cov42-Phaeocystis_antarctica.AAC.1